MTCDALREWMSADLDGETTPAERESVRRHLESCPACRRARAAASALRTGLIQAASPWPDAEASDERVLAMLRQEGRCRIPDPSPSLRSAVAGWFRRLTAVSSLRPALAAMAVMFLLTWTALRWAESPMGTAPSRDNTPLAALDGTPGAGARPLDTALLEQWLAGSPTLSALSRLQRVTSPGSERPAAPRRGSAGGGPSHMG
jgi:predicted anti-sigma-YlaC factor YlaD